ncbi:GreA/GreB family elongation factor [Chitinophagaceae bacterium LWZ2-11]
MKHVNKELILLEDDYKLLLNYINHSELRPILGEQDAKLLLTELKKGTFVNKENFPADVIRIHSKVKIVDNITKRKMEFELVMPQKANLKEGKVSILAPLGIALIGFRKNQVVEWKMPAGNKQFTILDVAPSETQLRN